LAIKNPPKKNHIKKTTKNVFLGFFDFLKFLIFYENKTNFSGFFSNPVLFWLTLGIFHSYTIATREVSGDTGEGNVEIENAGCCNDCNTYLPQKASRCLKVLTNEKRGVLSVV
jgi:hypothetical protein